MTGGLSLASRMLSGNIDISVLTQQYCTGYGHSLLDILEAGVAVGLRHIIVQLGFSRSTTRSNSLLAAS